MILLDTGPWLALLDRADAEHDRCKKQLRLLAAPLSTTWPVFTEVLHLLGSRVGWSGQSLAWAMVLDKAVRVESPTERLVRRTHTLMSKYKDVPMDIADASLVALSEQLCTRRVFTLDSDFLVYRHEDRLPFVLIG